MMCTTELDNGQHAVAKMLDNARNQHTMKCRQPVISSWLLWGRKDKLVSSNGVQQQLVSKQPFCNTTPATGGELVVKQPFWRQLVEKGLFEKEVAKCECCKVMVQSVHSWLGVKFSTLNHGNTSGWRLTQHDYIAWNSELFKWIFM